MPKRLERALYRPLFSSESNQNKEQVDGSGDQETQTRLRGGPFGVAQGVSTMANLAYGPNDSDSAQVCDRLGSVSFAPAVESGVDQFSLVLVEGQMLPVGTSPRRGTSDPTHININNSTLSIVDLRIYLTNTSGYLYEGLYKIRAADHFVMTLSPPFCSLTLKIGDKKYNYGLADLKGLKTERGIRFIIMPWGISHRT